MIHLAMLEPGAMRQAVAELHRAERLFDFAPELSAISCRKALETLARQFENQLRIERPRDAGGSSQSRRLRDIASHYRTSPPYLLGDVWNRLHQLNSETLNKVTHGEVSFSEGQAIDCFREFHGLTLRICRALIPDLPNSEYRVPRGISEELEEQRRLREDAQQAAARAAEDRRSVSEQLEQANRDVEQLRATPASARTDRDRRELLASEALVETLRLRLGELDARRQKAEEDRGRIAERNAGLEAELKRLREASSEDSVAHAEMRGRLARMMNYRDGYPKRVPEVASFLAASLRGDGDGPLPPFEGMSELQPLPSDPHADRWEASLDGRRCTLRLVTQGDRIPPEDLLRFWRFETKNMELLRQRRGLPRLAEALLWPERDRPGFVAFARPPGPTLDQFGSGGRAIDLAHGLRFALALHEALEARDSEGFIASWPDAGTVGVEGGLPILLEPTATHFGDLGPQSFFGMDIEAIRLAGRVTIDAAWIFVLSQAFLRVVGMLPRSGEVRTLTQVRSGDFPFHGLSEARRRCDVPIALKPLRELSGLLRDGLSPVAEDRPTLLRLIEAIRATLG